jgi:hypothetical protein
MNKTLILAIAMLVACDEAAAQAFKCVEAGGRILYSGKPCSDLGLKDAGEVQDRLQVTPAPPKRPPTKTTASSPPQVEQKAKPAAAEEKPERRCFTTTVKGKSVTRCNDKPDEE